MTAQPRTSDTRVSSDRAADDEVDPLLIGRRIRARRTERGMSLAELAAALDRAPSQLSVIENGRRELRLGELRRIARALEVGVEDLLDPEPPSRRAALEIALEKAQAGALYQGLGLPDLPVRKTQIGRASCRERV